MYATRIPVRSSLPREWRDISDYYETLFDQRYGTEDVTWGKCEAAYRFAWELGHRPEYRGRPWTEVADIIRTTWQSRSSAVSWDRVADGMEDVWQDLLDSP